MGLGDPRLPVIQRQVLAERIGHVQGNGHLRQVVAKTGRRRQLPQGLISSNDSAILQRDNDDAQPGAAPNAPANGDAASPAQASEAEQRYNITLQVAPGSEESYPGVAQTEALRLLREFYSRIHNRVEAGYDSHTYLKSIRDDQWIVGAISDFFADPLAGGIEMPPLWMWSEPRIALEAALATLNAGQVEPTARNLQRAADAWRRCDRRIYAYREGTISGAERTVTGLRVTAAAGAVAATMATGGIATAAGAGTLGVASATGLGAGVYGFVQEEAGQASEIYNDLRRDFDWGAIVRRGATDAINGFVGALAGGALTRVFQRSFGSFLANISDDVLLELGLTRDAFLTPAQQFIAEFLGGIGSSPLTTAVTAVVNAAGGGNPPRNAQEFVDLVVQDMVQGGAIQLFLGGLMHFHGRTGGGAPPAGGGVHPAGGETPTGPRATIVEEGSGVSRPTAPPAASAGETSAASLPSPTVEVPASQHPASRPASMASGEVETGGTSNGRIATVEGESAPGRPTEVPPEALRVGEGERSPVPPPAEAHYPEGLAEFGLDAAGARRSYRVSLEADLTREAGIWMDPQSGEHVVVQGGRDFVETGWMTSPEMQRSGRMPNWRLVEHYHPEAHGLVERLPSYNDFESIMHWQTVSAETPRPVSSVIRYTDPQTHIEFTTRFGYSPAEARPYWVEYRTPDGRWVSQQFSDPPWNPGSEYSQFMSQSGGMAAPGRESGSGVTAPGNGGASTPESREAGTDATRTSSESEVEGGIRGAPSPESAPLAEPTRGRLEGERDYKVRDPANPGREITDIDHIEGNTLWEDKSAVNGIDQRSGVDRTSEWIARHITTKFTRILEARQYLPGYEQAQIGFHFTRSGADPAFRAAVEAEIGRLQTAYRDVVLRTRWE